jgi:hypothetical protein
MLVRSCIPQTRTRESARECPSESKCQIWSTRWVVTQCVTDIDCHLSPPRRCPGGFLPPTPRRGPNRTGCPGSAPRRQFGMLTTTVKRLAATHPPTALLVGVIPPAPCREAYSRARDPILPSPIATDRSILFRPYHLSGFRIDKVQLRACQACDRLIRGLVVGPRRRTIPALFGRCSGSDRERRHQTTIAQTRRRSRL